MITLYIPVHNAERHIGACLEAVLRQTLRPDEILVVNDGSTDRTAEIARRFPARIVDLPSHPGLAAARNAAIGAARGDYVASLDVDSVPDPTWLERLAADLDEGGAAGAGGKMVEHYRRAAADRWRSVHMRQHWGDRRLDNPPFLFGCNTVFRRDALESVGAYDVRCRTNGEDVDISQRLMAAGHALIYDPGALVRHMKRDSVLSVLRAERNWAGPRYGGGIKYEKNSNIVYHNFTNAKFRFSEDWAEGRYRLLSIDLLLFFAGTYWDMDYATGLRRSPHFGLASRIDTLTAFHRHLTQLSQQNRLPENMEQ